MSMAATLAAALAASSGGGSSSRLMRSAREIWLNRLLTEDDDSDSAAENGPGDDGDQHSVRLPLPPPTLPAAPVTSTASAASVVVDLTASEESGERSSSDTASSSAGTSRFLGIIVDDDDDDSDSDSDVVVTETTQPATSGNAANNRAGRKRPRNEIANHAEPDLVVVETQVVEKAQATECTVCCDACTTSGPHRLVALKCGHLFGKQCIDRWMLTKKACPMCNVAVRKPDIRPLFSDHVAVVDNSGVAAMTEKFEAEQAKRIRLEAEIAQLRAQHQTEVLRLNEALAAAQGKPHAGAAVAPKPKPRWK